MATKVLYRSTKDRKVAGLIGGIAEYMDADANLLRLIAAVLIVFSGVLPGLLAYIIGAAVVPTAPEKK